MTLDYLRACALALVREAYRAPSPIAPPRPIVGEQWEIAAQDLSTVPGVAPVYLPSSYTMVPLTTVCWTPLAGITRRRPPPGRSLRISARLGEPIVL